MTTTSFPPNAANCSASEWRARVDLAACYRLVSRFRMTDLIYNHISAAVPDEPGHFLINEFGLHYDEITASNLLKVNLAGEVIGDDSTGHEVNKAGYIIHSAIHEGRPDVRCVIHTHTRAGVAVAAMRCGLLPISQTALRFYRRIAYHDFEGPAVEAEERGRLVNDLGECNAMILRNHGLLSCAPSISEAFLIMQRLETACQTQVDVMAAGAEIIEIDRDVCEKSAIILAPSSEQRGELHFGEWNGKREWDAMIRALDREGADFRR
ncbi:class II aldolase/adducin family protein [Caballeronia sp. ATUFL_M1_KS5A]|uniref:class II aldolase/adducin family protein n=1 Tax=Caballeronia sp. ATUFL_M1_KS5A TaxID=2921778 RepID=UPI0020279817|nr:class II aldolase/adducin family protein [Caballeronia sp. ATUFL_M1_KS5A]